MVIAGCHGNQTAELAKGEPATLMPLVKALLYRFKAGFTLYAAGNDLQSIMGGVYPGPGITIGPAITFAYMAVNHAAGELA